jgi:hypothetical protein
MSEPLSMQAIATQYNIPKEHLRVMKLMNKDGSIPGFNKNNMINWEKLQPWYVANMASVAQQCIKEEGSLSEQINKEKLVKIKLENANLRKELVPIKDVEAFMITFGIQFTSVLKTKLINELPPRLTGLKESDIREVNTNVYNDIIALYQKEVKEWNKENDVK